MIKKILGFVFLEVCKIELMRSKNGTVIISYPQSRYDNKKGYALHRYGKGGFCGFKILPKWSGRSGLYFFTLNNKIRYVGECQDLYNRINSGYGLISPRNCFVRGQSTNCKINKFVLNHYKRKRIKLWFCQTSNLSDVERRNLEDRLIEYTVPDLNG